MKLEEEIRKQQMEVDAAGSYPDYMGPQLGMHPAPPREDQHEKQSEPLKSASTVFDTGVTVAWLCLVIGGTVIYALLPAVVFALAGVSACSMAVEENDDSSHLYFATSAICFLASYAGVMLFAKMIQYVGKQKI